MSSGASGGQRYWQGTDHDLGFGVTSVRRCKRFIQSSYFIFHFKTQIDRMPDYSFAVCAFLADRGVRHQAVALFAMNEVKKLSIGNRPGVFSAQLKQMDIPL